MAQYEKFDIRHFGLEEAPAMTAISADVGWNQPEEEIREIIRRSGKYLLGAFRDGALVGVAAAYPYPDGGFAYVNEVIVSSTCRNRGAATQLLSALLPLTERDYPTLRLCATAMGRPIYEKFGFVPFATLSFGELTGKTAEPECDGIAPMREADLEDAYELDAANFGAHRPEIIRTLWEKSPEASWILRRGGCLEGFIMRASMNWFLQCRDGGTFAALLRCADARSRVGRVPALIREEHVALLPAPLDEHFKLTLMQYGGSVPVPAPAFSGFLPDIG